MSANASERITRDNHFVPQAYLRRWSDDGTHVSTYRLLVSHQNVPLWTTRAISGIAFRTHLYTSVDNGRESDEFERWMEREFEKPAESALRKVEREIPLTPDDWERLAYYSAAQQLRTPASFQEHRERMERTTPDTLRRVLAASLTKLERAAQAGKTLKPNNNESAPSHRVPLRVRTEPSDDGKQMVLRAEVTVGRESWLASNRRLLTGVAKVLARHSWAIMRADASTEWFTSDHPVIRLNYYKLGSYDFKGGWGNKGSEMLMPLSPRHLLYTQVGVKQHQKMIALSAEKTLEMQKLMAEHAHRSIYARQPIRRVAWFRPRLVDAELFKAEEDGWNRWHAEQSEAELRRRNA